MCGTKLGRDSYAFLVCSCTGRCTLPELRERQSAVLSAVHEFFLRVISRSLQHDVPLPAGLQPLVDTPASLEVLEKWLDVLDLAISPQMFRDEMAYASTETAAALLKFYTRHPAEIGRRRGGAGGGGAGRGRRA